MPKSIKNVPDNQLSLFDYMRQCNSIYALIDPRDNRVFYVGRTAHIPTRLTTHISKARWYMKHQPRSWRWHEPTSAKIVDIMEAGLLPTARELQVTPRKIQYQAELWWMAYYIKRGYELTNVDRPQVVDGKYVPVKRGEYK